MNYSKFLGVRYRYDTSLYNKILIIALPYWWRIGFNNKRWYHCQISRYYRWKKNNSFHPVILFLCGIKTSPQSTTLFYTENPEMLEHLFFLYRLNLYRITLNDPRY